MKMRMTVVKKLFIFKKKTWIISICVRFLYVSLKNKTKIIYVSKYMSNYSIISLIFDLAFDNEVNFSFVLGLDFHGERSEIEAPFV